jgi:hypothetical protein
MVLRLPFALSNAAPSGEFEARALRAEPSNCKNID